MPLVRQSATRHAHRRLGGAANVALGDGNQWTDRCRYHRLIIWRPRMSGSRPAGWPSRHGRLLARHVKGVRIITVLPRQPAHLWH